MSWVNPALVQRPMFLGAEQKPAFIFTIACVGIIWFSHLWWVAIVTVAPLWSGGMWFLRKMAADDPAAMAVYLAEIRLPDEWVANAPVEMIEAPEEIMPVRGYWRR